MNVKSFIESIREGLSELWCEEVSNFLIGLGVLSIILTISYFVGHILNTQKPVSAKIIGGMITTFFFGFFSYVTIVITSVLGHFAKYIWEKINS